MTYFADVAAAVAAQLLTEVQQQKDKQMEPKTAIDLPESAKTEAVQKLNSGALVLADQYDNFAIATTDEFMLAGEQLKQIKTLQSELEEKRFTITRPMDAAKKAVMELFRAPTERLAAAELNIKKAIGTWQTEQERIAKERQRQEQERRDKEAKRLRDEARAADERAAKKERDRLAREQAAADERARIECERLAEQQAEAEERARKAAEEARDEDERQRGVQRASEDARRLLEQQEREAKRATEEQERLHQESMAAEAEARDRTARAENLVTRADDLQAGPIATAAPKVKGLSTGKNWKFEITDASQVPPEYKMVDEKKIGAVVKALKGDTNIAGVRVYWEPRIGARKG